MKRKEKNKHSTKEIWKKKWQWNAAIPESCQLESSEKWSSLVSCRRNRNLPRGMNKFVTKK